MVAPWSIRLVGGIYDNEGRVEVFIDNQWGTICDSLWSIEDANVVCRQLNYSGADLVQVAGQFGRGRGDIMFTNMQCTGMERNLSTCQYDQVNDIRCDHSRDAGVICTSQGKVRFFFRMLRFFVCLFVRLFLFCLLTFCFCFYHCINSILLV